MKTIVICEDSMSIVQILKAYIRAADDKSYNIKTFCSIRKASEFITDNQVDLLFQDVHVNGIQDGLIVAGIAKEKHIPVAIITADSSLDNLQNIASNQYDRYILKPITQQDVNKALRKLLK